MLVTMGSHHAAQPQAGAHLNRHRQPQNHALCPHADFIGLDLAQVSGLLDQMLMHPLTVLSGLLLQPPHGALIPTKGMHNRLDWAAVGQQGHDDDDQLVRFARAIERRAFGLRKCLVTHVADVAPLFLTVHADVAFADLPPCHTLRIGAEYTLWVHGFTLLACLVSQTILCQ